MMRNSSGDWPRRRVKFASHAAREAVVDTVRATADALSASLEQMQLVEDMRRTLREVRDHNKLESN